MQAGKHSTLRKTEMESKSMDNAHPIIDLTSSSEEAAANDNGPRCKKAVRRQLQLEITDYLQAPPPPQPRDLSGSLGLLSWGQDDDVDGDDDKDEDDNKGGGACIGEGKGREGHPCCPCGATEADVTPNHIGGHSA